ncbi:MAG: calcium/sodium antiporter [Spirochaetaceae bacterium]|nr:MAG: calcium/sodium antiporter [Spirochaetaceae bacterium]
MDFLPDNIFVHLLVLAVTFLIIYKAADFLVDGAVGIAYKLNVPKIVIGVVLVGFGTTAPEFTVSVLSAIRGFPEIALGNAVGSVIVDDTMALGLGIIVAPVAIRVERRSLRLFGLFLIAIDVLVFLLSLNGIVGRWEGLFLLGILVLYLAYVIHTENRKRKTNTPINEELAEHIKTGGLGMQGLRFLIGLAGVILSSELLINSSVYVAKYFGASEAVIGLTLVAIGTSIPEIVTCVVASRRGHGDLALGDIIGADILNVLWIIGAASVANPIQVEKRVILFAFPWMLGVVVLMLSLARLRYSLQRWKGILLVVVYLLYITIAIVRFYVS